METSSGIINAVGLQNPGVDVFLKRDIPFLQKFDTKVIVNVCGNTVEDYLKVVERLSEHAIDMLEINISCPNVEHGGIAFGQEPKMVEYITKEIKKVAKQPISMKLTPNVTDITEIAKAAEFGGADALSLINTITGMKQAAAVYAALQEQNITYAVPPASFERAGQRVRLCDMVISQKLGTCLDLTLLYVSCIEAIGLHPVLVLLQGHIFAGVWLENYTFPDAILDDAAQVTKRLIVAGRAIGHPCNHPLSVIGLREYSQSIKERLERCINTLS